MTLKQMDIRQLKPGPGATITKMDTTKYNTTYDVLKAGIDDATLDVVQVGDLDIWVDDEGLLKGLDPTIIIKRSEGDSITEMDTLLVGPVVFAGSNQQGDTVGLSPKAIKIIESMQPAIINMDGGKPVYVIQV